MVPQYLDDGFLRRQFVRTNGRGAARSDPRRAAMNAPLEFTPAIDDNSEIDTSGCSPEKGDKAEEPDNGAFMAAVFHALPDGAAATVTSFLGKAVGKVRAIREDRDTGDCKQLFLRVQPLSRR